MATSVLCLRCEFLNLANALAIIHLYPMLCEPGILWEPVALLVWLISLWCLWHQDGRQRVCSPVLISQRLLNFGICFVRSYNYLQVCVSIAKYRLGVKCFWPKPWCSASVCKYGLLFVGVEQCDHQCDLRWFGDFGQTQTTLLLPPTWGHLPLPMSQSWVG